MSAAACWIAVLLDTLPLQVFVRDHDPARATTPERTTTTTCRSASGPNAVGPALLAVREPPPGNHIIAASPAATAAGIVPGIRLASALALAPALVTVNRDPALEQALLHETAQLLARFSPTLSLDPPDGVLLEVSTTLQLFGGPEALWQQIERTLSQARLRTRCAMAPTPLAARWLAQCAPGSRLPPHPGWAQRLAALPLAVLDDAVAPALLARLDELGLRTLGDIARLPRDGLAQRQGGPLLQRLARAQGRNPDPRPNWQPPEAFDSRFIFEWPTTEAPRLQRACQRLNQRLAQWLQARQAVAATLEYRFHDDAGAVHAQPVHCSTPERDPTVFDTLISARLERLALSAPVERIHLHVASVSTPAAHHQDLFGDPHDNQEALGRLFDRLRARLGADALRQYPLHDDHRPEHAGDSRPVHPADSRTTPAEPANGAQPPKHTRPDRHPKPADLADPDPAHPANTAAALRPVWLLACPQPVRIGTFTLLRGPERIDTGWWDDQPVCRDYYLARAADQRLCWLFRDRRATGNAWFLHGHFG